MNDMRIRYEDHEFSPAVQGVIRQANRIIADYAAQGYRLTLRQLYYRFVSLGLLPNTVQSYKRLGKIVNDARMAGRISWDAIEDRTRWLRSMSHWTDPVGVITSAANSYRQDLWDDQPYRVEVWIEKDALVGVCEPVCQELDIPLFSCRGYASASEVWGASQRLEGYMKAEQRVVILHFGDHDPSGIDMTRDIEDRLRLFLFKDWVRHEAERLDYVPNDELVARLQMERDQSGAGWDQWLEIRRMALNFDQVEEHQPPPNPAKETDSRFAGYQAEHGDESWELDALEPAVLDDLVRRGVNDVIDQDAYDAAVARQQEGTDLLNAVVKRWADVEELLNGGADGQ